MGIGRWFFYSLNRVYYRLCYLFWATDTVVASCTSLLKQSERTLNTKIKINLTFYPELHSNSSDSLCAICVVVVFYSWQQTFSLSLVVRGSSGLILLFQSRWCSCFWLWRKEGRREKPTQAMGDHVNPTQRNLHAVGQKSLEDCWFTISVSEYDSLSSTSGKAPSVLEKGQRANESRIC